MGVSHSLWTALKKAVPVSLKSGIKDSFEQSRFQSQWGFRKPPVWSDSSGYETILEQMANNGLDKLDGDVVEIGAFLGGGTYTLSNFLSRRAPGKKLYVADIFKAEFDQTPTTYGYSMAELYARVLAGRDQKQVYQDITKECKNVVTLEGDSKGLILPCDKVVFAFIDGNHSAEYVRNDFYVVWPKLVPGGVIGFDDYGYDLPPVTDTLNEIMAEEMKSIARIWTRGNKLLFIQKRS
jgi:hypothetical protein